MAEKHVLIIGDSTGDGIAGNSADGAAVDEMVFRLGRDTIGAADATACVIFRHFDERQYSYTPGIVIQEGTGGDTWHLWNACVSGRTPQSFTGSYFNGAIGATPKPMAIIWNHGHNVAAQHPNDAAVLGRFIGPMDQVRQQWPGVPQMLIRQNPWRDDTGMDHIMTANTSIASLYGDMIVADVHAHFITNSKPAGWYTDNIHPNATGHAQIQPIVSTAWTALLALPSTFGARPAFVSSKATNLLSNGNLKQFASGVPTGWTLTGNGTCALDGRRIDAGDTSSVKLVNGTTATKLSQTLTGMGSYVGQTLWLAVRQYIIDETNISTGPYWPSAAKYLAFGGGTAGGDKSRGRVSISANGTGTPVSNQDAGNTFWGGTNGWRWSMTSLLIPAGTTTVTVDLCASGVTGVDEGVCFGRAVLVAGSDPRDAL